MMSVVYILQCGADGPIKIGTTSGLVATRIAQIQAASPYKLRWIGAFTGGREEEKAAHLKLIGSKLRGEWFYPTAEVVKFIADQGCAQFDPDDFLDTVCHRKELRILRQALKKPERNLYDFAEDAGWTRDQIRDWHCYLAPPSDEMISQIMGLLERIDEVPTDYDRRVAYLRQHPAAPRLVECPPSEPERDSA